MTSPRVHGLPFGFRAWIDGFQMKGTACLLNGGSWPLAAVLKGDV